MANIIKLKRSETAGSAPTSGDLEIGEVCINIVDGKIYTKKSDGTIVTVSDKTTGQAELELTSTDASSSAGPGLDLFRNSFSPFDSDELGKIDFSGENDNSDKKVFAKLLSKIVDASATTEDGELEIHVMNAGTVEEIATVKSDGLHIASGKAVNFADGTSMTTTTGLGGGQAYGIALDGLLVKCPDGTSGGIALDGLLTKAGANDAVGKISRLQDDTSPMLGGNLTLNGNNISGTGTVTATSFHGDGSGLTGVGVDLSGIQQDILNLAINQAIADNRIAFNLTDSFVDGFEDDSGIDDGGNLTGCVRDTGNEFVCTISGEAVDSNYVLVVQSDTSGGGNSFTDESDTGHTLSISSDPEHSTTQSHIGQSSIHFDGDDKIYASADHSDFAFGTGDFTLETWIYWTNNSTSNCTLIGNRTAASTTQWMFYLGTGPGLLTFSDASANQCISNSALTGNTWHHVALTRDSGTLRIYQNGVQTASAANSLNLSATNKIYLGAGDIAGWNNNFQGYMDGVRVSKTCRYPNGTTFTPYTENLGLVANATGTLISDVQTAPESTTTASGVILYEDEHGTATLGTDLKLYFSADNKSTWTEASSYSTPTTYTGSKKLVKLGNTTVTGGTQVAIKAEWANQSSGSKVTRLHGWAVNY